MPAAIAERIKLFHVAQLQRGLFGDPGTQAGLERAVGEGIERSEGEGIRLTVLACDGEDQWLLVVDGDDRRVQSDLDARRGFVHSVVGLEAEGEWHALECQLAAADP